MATSSDPWYTGNKPLPNIIAIVVIIFIWLTWKTIATVITIMMYIFGTTAWNFFALLALFCLICFLLKRFVTIPKQLTFLPKLGILYVVFLLMNCIPFLLPHHEYNPSFGEYIEPKSIAIGWPTVIGKYYLGDGDLCPACVDKKPIHAGMMKKNLGALIPNTIFFTMFILPFGLFYLRRT